MIGIFYLLGAAAAALVLLVYRFVRAERESGAAIRREIDAQTAYFKARDSHCDACALDLAREPVHPIVRCPMHCAGVAGLVGDPLFGFDFEKYSKT